ncbi:MAG TPA: CBS domain-containing protein, partial [Actinoplanes sp.]|nr:CBS domain-containing protein [Actinoplanes sp.]
MTEPLLGTAAAHASARVPTAAPGDLVGTALAAMRGRRFDSVSVIVVSDGGVLSGVVTMEALLAAPGSARLADVMDAAPPVVGPDTDQERAAWLAVQHGEPALAVVDDGGRFVGLIPPQRLLAVLLAEHDEDLARLGGFLGTTAAARASSQERLARRMWHRLPWLLLGL